MSDAQPAASAANAADTGHEYDGIREHDNKLPRWWLFTLYGAIAFAFFYWLYYQTFGVGLSPREQYAVDAAAAHAQQVKREEEEARLLTDEALTKMKDDPAIVKSGHDVYVSTCMPCHGDKGQGVVGPNLTDEFWIHGGKPTDALKVISEGVALKGMPTWKPVLGATKVRDVSVFLLTLHGTHAVGKAAEGVDDVGHAAPTPPTPTPPAPTPPPPSAPPTAAAG